MRVPGALAKVLYTESRYGFVQESPEDVKLEFCPTLVQFNTHDVFDCPCNL